MPCDAGISHHHTAAAAAAAVAALIQSSEAHAAAAAAAAAMQLFQSIQCIAVFVDTQTDRQTDMCFQLRFTQF